jgi:hypothetical protein
MRRTAIVAALLVVASLTPSPALAHTDAELSAWLGTWSAQEITPATLDEWLDMAERHPCRLIPCPPEASPTIKASIFRPDPIPIAPGAFAPAVERWRALVAIYFPAENVDAALSVLSCESQGSEWADNPYSTASGLFQHLGSLWPPRAEAAGWGGASIWDPAANVAVAAWLSQGGSDWGDWAASRRCHGL